MHPALAALLTNTVQHAPYLGQDAYGAPSYGPAVPRPARIESKTQAVVVTATGAIVSQSIVYFDGNVSIDERDKLTLEDGSSPAIQQVEMMPDLSGQPYYYRVHL